MNELKESSRLICGSFCRSPTIDLTLFMSLRCLEDIKRFSLQENSCDDESSDDSFYILSKWIHEIHCNRKKSIAALFSAICQPDDIIKINQICYKMSLSFSEIQSL
jgi:hypothetical protein